MDQFNRFKITRLFKIIFDFTPCFIGSSWFNGIYCNVRIMSIEFFFENNPVNRIKMAYGDRININI